MALNVNAFTARDLLDEKMTHKRQIIEIIRELARISKHISTFAVEDSIATSIMKRSSLFMVDIEDCKYEEDEEDDEPRQLRSKVLEYRELYDTRTPSIKTILSYWFRYLTALVLRFFQLEPTAHHVEEYNTFYMKSCAFFEKYTSKQREVVHMYNDFMKKLAALQDTVQAGIGAPGGPSFLFAGEYTVLDHVRDGLHVLKAECDFYNDMKEEIYKLYESCPVDDTPPEERDLIYDESDDLFGDGHSLIIAKCMQALRNKNVFRKRAIESLPDLLIPVDLIAKAIEEVSFGEDFFQKKASCILALK